MVEFEYTRRVELGKEYLFRQVLGKFTVEDEIDMIQYAMDHDLIDERIVGMVIDLKSYLVTKPNLHSFRNWAIPWRWDHLHHSCPTAC